MPDPMQPVPPNRSGIFFCAGGPHLSLQQLQSNPEPIRQREKNKDGDRDHNAEEARAQPEPPQRKSATQRNDKREEGGRGADNEAQKDKTDPIPKSKGVRAGKGERQGERQ